MISFELLFLVVDGVPSCSCTLISHKLYGIAVGLHEWSRSERQRLQSETEMGAEGMIATHGKAVDGGKGGGGKGKVGEMHNFQSPVVRPPVVYLHHVPVLTCVTPRDCIAEQSIYFGA